MSSDEHQAPAAKKGGILCALTPWKAALLGPYVDFTGLGVILPLIPFFLQDIGANPVWIGAILSAQYGGVVIGSMFWGRLADYVDVRSIYILLLVLDAGLFFASALVETAEMLLLARGLAGFCAIMPLGTVWVSTTAPPDKQMFAFTMLFVSIIGGFITGSAIGGLLGTWDTGIGVGGGGWFASVALSAVFCVIVLFIIVLGTASPPRIKGAAVGKPEGVKAATTTLEFLACMLSGFVGAQEGAMTGVVLTTVFTNPAPLANGTFDASLKPGPGYGYSENGMGIVFVIIASNLLVSSLVFAGWLGKRTQPQQRIVLLGIMTTITSTCITLVFVSWEMSGLWASGDYILLCMLLVLFCFQCVVGPTSMDIASRIAAAKTKNANGTIMGMQQMAMNLGQAIGPVLAAFLLSFNYYLPFMYLAISELVILIINFTVFWNKQNPKEGSGEVALDRSLFDLSTVVFEVAPVAEASDVGTGAAEADTPDDAKPATLGEMGGLMAKWDRGPDQSELKRM